MINNETRMIYYLTITLFYNYNKESRLHKSSQNQYHNVKYWVLIQTNYNVTECIGI